MGRGLLKISKLIPFFAARRCRANARRSAGPRTARGKARPSMNAVKHGLARPRDRRLTACRAVRPETVFPGLFKIASLSS
jgi:hypothetical protein